MKVKEWFQIAASNEMRSTYNIGNLIVNVKSCFYPEKNLSDILFAIISMRLKEKSA